MYQKKINLLLTSVGRRNYIVDYFKEALGNDGVVIAANSVAMTSAMVVADRHIVTPSILDNEYIPFLKNVCVEESISAILPLFDLDVYTLSSHKREFLDIGVQVLVSDFDLITACYDKLQYPDMLRKLDIPSPAVYSSIQNVLNLLSIGSISFPLLLKPRWGSGSLYLQVVNSISELSFFYDFLQNLLLRKPLPVPVPSQLLNEIIIQEFVEGIEYGMDLICDLKGNYKTTIVRRKLGMRSGETDGALVIYHKELEEFGARFSAFSHHIGIIDVDAIITSDGKISIIDINPRFGGGYPFSHAAGINLPKCMINWITDKVEKPEWLEYQTGIVALKGISIHTAN